MLFSCNSSQSTDLTIKNEKQSILVNDTINKDYSFTSNIVEDVPAQVVKLNFAEMTMEDYASLVSKEAINNLFGAESVVDGVSLYEEGTVEYKHTVVTNPATTHIVKYVWKDNDSLKWVEANYIKRSEDFEEVGIQMLGSECGINLGMPLKDVVVWNGDDFKFFGFGWDFGGNVRAKENSKIANCSVTFDLGIKYDDMKGNETIIGDVELSSSDSAVKNAGVFIASFKCYPSK